MSCSRERAHDRSANLFDWKFEDDFFFSNELGKVKNAFLLIRGERERERWIQQIYIPYDRYISYFRINFNSNIARGALNFFLFANKF